MNSHLNLNELWKVGSPPAKKIKKTREECWFNNVTLYEDKLKSDRDIFRWGGWTFSLAHLL